MLRLGRGKAASPGLDLGLRPRAEPSVRQGLPALQHAPQDDGHAARRADALDPAVRPLALAVVGLVLVPPRPRADLLAAPGGRGAFARGREGQTVPEGAAEERGSAELDRAGGGRLEWVTAVETTQQRVRTRRRRDNKAPFRSPEGRGAPARPPPRPAAPPARPARYRAPRARAQSPASPAMAS